MQWVTLIANILGLVSELLHSHANTEQTITTTTRDNVQRNQAA